MDGSLGCDDDCALPSYLLVFSAGISVYASFWFYTRRLETLKKGSGRRRSTRRVFSQSSSQIVL